jgi:hypothetical protein
MRVARNVLQIIGQHVDLRKVGREWRGRCPFHKDKNPSFNVNADEGLFHCFGCGVGGDPIRFVELAEQTDFKGALKILGIDGWNYEAKPVGSIRSQRAAEMLADWLNRHHLLIGVQLRDLSRKIALAESIPDRELVESLCREWEVLSDLHEALQNPVLAEELFGAKDFIESITQWAQLEPLPEFPELTAEYRAYLSAAVRGELC